MEDLAPPLKFALEVEQALKNGESLRRAILNYSKYHADPFATDVKRFMVMFDHGQSICPILERSTSAYRKALLELLMFGLQGESILPQLQAIKDSIEKACEQEIEEHLRTLPIKMMVLVMIFMVPGYLMLLFGPLLIQLSRSLA